MPLPQSNVLGGSGSAMARRRSDPDAPRRAKPPHRAPHRVASGWLRHGWLRTPTRLPSHLARSSGGVALFGAIRRDRLAVGQIDASRAALVPSAPCPRQTMHACGGHFASGSGRRRPLGAGGFRRDVGLTSPSFQAWRNPSGHGPTILPSATSVSAGGFASACATSRACASRMSWSRARVSNCAVSACFVEPETVEWACTRGNGVRGA